MEINKTLPYGEKRKTINKVVKIGFRKRTN